LVDNRPEVISQDARFKNIPTNTRVWLAHDVEPLSIEHGALALTTIQTCPTLQTRREGFDPVAQQNLSVIVTN
jgi:hypothetical protein